MSSVFSGEPLPLQPNVESPEELARFHFKVIEYLRRLGAKLDNTFNDPPGDPPGLAKIPAVSMTLKERNGLSEFLFSSDFITGGQTGWGTPPEANIPWETDPLIVPWLDEDVFEIQSTGAVKILKDGLYHIAYELGFDRSRDLVPFAPNLPLIDSRLILQEDQFAFIPRGGWLSVRENEGISYAAVFPIREGIIINTECIAHQDEPPGPAPEIRYEFIESRFHIMRLQSGVTGGGPGGAGWPLAGAPPWVWLSFGYY